MQWFQSVNQKNKMKRYPFIPDLESIYCRLMDTEVKTFIPLVEARADQFLCQYQTHCFSLCQCCQFDSCDCEMTCPDGCSCYHDNSWSKNIIQCSHNGYQSLPASMPMDATEIHLDGNNLATLKSHSLIGRKNLRSIHLNNSNIEKIENKTFNGLRNLRTLNLENNKLRRLRGFEFAGLSHLRELHLAGNLISAIHNATFAALKSLEVLSLANNAIIDFPVWQLGLNPYLVSIQLAGNLWSCDCHFLNQFSSWLSAATSRVTDGGQVECITNEADAVHSNVLVMNHKEKVCDIPIMAIAKTQVQEKLLGNYLPLLIAGLASFSMLVIFGFILFSFRHSIKIWVQSKKEDRVLDSRLESPKSSTYGGEVEWLDCFVSYSPLDRQFVEAVLGAELESGGEWRACLHHRDLACTAPAHPAAVAQAALAARKTVVVLSSNYLATEAGLLPALAPHTSKLIFILVGTPEAALANPGLRALLSCNIVLQWGEPRFWAKLRYALPSRLQAVQHSESHYYSTCKFPQAGPLYQEKVQATISHI